MEREIRLGVYWEEISRGATVWIQSRAQTIRLPENYSFQDGFERDDASLDVTKDKSCLQ